MTIDPSILDEYRSLMGKESDAFIAEVVTTYLENTPRVMARLIQALAQSDVNAVARQAHSIKGGSLSVGANRLAELAGGMEDRARDGSLDGAAETMTALQQEFAAVAKAMRALAGLPPAE